MASIRYPQFRALYTSLTDGLRWLWTQFLLRVLHLLTRRPPAVHDSPTRSKLIRRHKKGSSK